MLRAYVKYNCYINEQVIKRNILGIFPSDIILLLYVQDISFVTGIRAGEYNEMQILAWRKIIQNTTKISMSNG